MKYFIVLTLDRRIVGFKNKIWITVSYMSAYNTDKSFSILKFYSKGVSFDIVGIWIEVELLKTNQPLLFVNLIPK